MQNHTEATVVSSERDDTEVTMTFIAADGAEIATDSAELPMSERLHSSGKLSLTAGAFIDATSIQYVVIKTRPRRWATFTGVAAGGTR